MLNLQHPVHRSPECAPMECMWILIGTRLSCTWIVPLAQAVQPEERPTAGAGPARKVA
jgi:hypothetical protein